jgi:glyoxylase-like metal-dependent hydrolase (beta-lactamase superfamily II)
VDVRTIALGNDELEGKNRVYVVDSGDMVGMVDAGSASDRTRDQLARRLADSGYVFDDIDFLALTHWHSDHVGLARVVKNAADATVYVHEDDAPLVRHNPVGVEAYMSDVEKAVRAWNVPQEKTAPFFEVTSRLSDEDGGVQVTAVSEGDTIAVGDLALEVIHTPGHTSGHACFAFGGKRGRELFSGDAILPVYTPNVGGSDVRVSSPLEQYADSLGRLADMDFVRCWPGHRTVVEEPTQRAREILDHHEDRARRIVATIEEHGEADVWTLSTEFFSDLDGPHAILGAGEIYAHVDHLTQRGVLNECDGRYSLAEGDVEAAVQF